MYIHMSFNFLNFAYYGDSVSPLGHIIIVQNDDVYFVTVDIVAILNYFVTVDIVAILNLLKSKTFNSEFQKVNGTEKDMELYNLIAIIDTASERPHTSRYTK